MAGSWLTSTATCTAYRAVCGGKPDAPGAQRPVAGRVFAERVGWLADLVRGMADQVIAARWSDTDLAVLADGVGRDGRRLPASGWMALRRLGWGAVAAAAGVVVSDRVRRIAEEEAARALRLGCHRRAVVAALLATWPADPFARTDGEWSALRAALPEGTDNATIRNRTRQITAYVGVHGRLPAGLCELEGPPVVARQVSLAAADRQQVVVDRVDDRMIRVWSQLPTCAAPVSYRDWVWHAFDVALPASVPAGVKVCSPTLRPRDGRVRVDLPWQTPHTPAPVDGHTRGLGVDWGVNTLLTGTVADLDQGGSVVVDGRPLRFDATGASAKLVRLRRHREHLKTKADHLTRLRDGRPAQADPVLTGKLARLEAEHAAVCARIRHLNHALAWSAARWLVDHATAVGATIIYVENLATLEAGGRSRSLNRRLSGAVRGTVFTAVAHLAAQASIAVVTVPARGTSSGCPRCGGAVTHVKTPDRCVAGYRWAICSCGLSLDRDHAAAQRIAARGLANQTKTRRDRNGQAAIRAATDTPVRRQARRSTPAATTRPVRDRRKTAPTPKQTRPATAKTSRLLPSRRQVPAPTEPPPGTGGKRPAGRTPQETNPPGPVHQVPQTASTTTARRHPHRVRGAVLGRGFHRHVHATPITNRDGGTGTMSAPLRIT